MKVKEFLEGTSYDANFNLDDIDISGISINSKEVKKGDAFFCLIGSDNGNKYISEAKKKGASVIISEYDLDNCIKVPDSRKAYSLASKNFYEKASDKLKIIGITGTNGKTTCSYMISNILKANGKNVAVIGTNGVFYNDKVIDTSFTTPDPHILHKLFYDIKNEGIDTVVMEVSAHAIYLKKIEGINFDVGVLTNITEDHLDYFKDMDEYALCKLSFLVGGQCKAIVLNADDKYGAFISEKVPLPVMTYGLKNPSDCFAIDICSNLDGTSFICNYFDDVDKIDTKFVGEFNVSNTLAAFCAVGSLGIPFNSIKHSLDYMEPVEGRFNILEYNNNKIVIDYAHTPDGLEKVLSTIRDIHPGKLRCVFGCGGNREHEKRPKMGAVAERYCDMVYVTSDNPRYENPILIVKDIESGMMLENHVCIVDREKAIERAMKDMKKDEVLVIAGKGAEKTQEINGKKFNFSDFDAVYKVFKKIAYHKKEGRYV